MFFLSKSILGSDESTVCLTPTHVNGITYLKLQNGLYDCLYITSETSSLPTSQCPPEWDFDTIFHADFNNTTNAGNVDWNLKTVSHLLIKRRKASDFKWMTLAVRQVFTIDDFDLKGTDYFNASETEYEYALVPAWYGTEGYYNTLLIKSEFNGIFIAEKNNIVGTQISDGFCDTTRCIPSATNVTINNRYPTYISNTIANYDKGTFKGNFSYIDEETCEIVETDMERVQFQRSIMDFLANRQPKLLKHFDGRMWLVQVTGDPTDTADEIYNKRVISFEWTEVGNYLSERDLYYTNLSDVAEEWWSG